MIDTPPAWVPFLQPAVTTVGVFLVVVGWRITLRLQRQKIAIEFLQRMTDQEVWITHERLVSRRMLADRQENRVVGETWLNIAQKRYEPKKYPPELSSEEVKLSEALYFILSGWEFIGSALHNRAVDPDILYDHLSARLVGQYTDLYPMIEYIRSYFDDQAMYEHFESVAKEWEVRSRLEDDMRRGYF